MTVAVRNAEPGTSAKRRRAGDEADDGEMLKIDKYDFNRYM
jgi:hypothetical protein